MERVRPCDAMSIRKSLALEPGTYLLPHGLEVATDGVEVVGEGVTIIGSGREGAGLTLLGRNDVIVRGLAFREFYHGIYAKDCRNVNLTGCDITATAEVQANTVFLDIWLAHEKAYGGGICLAACESCDINGNNLQHQMNGLLTYGCKSLAVSKNNCNYNSGFGIHLFATCDSLFEDNSCDYCCRFEPRDGGLHFGHMGADAAGFLAVMGSCRNRFSRNAARLGGDGFFLAGLTPDMAPCGCDDNVFEENDASLSPNIAFEATFCEGNVYRNNVADRCNYGFWCGYSKDFVIEDNRILLNRQAGIAVENGVGFQVRGNTFQGNGHGVLLWSHHNEAFLRAYRDRDTSRDWFIERNRFLRNGYGIRIGCDKDHGIRDVPQDQCGPAESRPHSHAVRDNDIQDNRVGVCLDGSDRNIVEGNRINANVESNVRLEDAHDNTIRNNLGAQGAYL